MYRLMQPQELPAVQALWQQQGQVSAAFARQALEHFAGLENVYVAVENDQLTAMALAVPVSLKGRPGSYLYGLCGEGSLDPGGPAGLPVCAAEAAGRRLYRGCAADSGGG